MAIESFDRAIYIDSKEVADRLIAIIESSEKVGVANFSFHDEEDIKKIREIFG